MGRSKAKAKPGDVADLQDSAAPPRSIAETVAEKGAAIAERIASEQAQAPPAVGDRDDWEFRQLVSYGRDERLARVGYLASSANARFFEPFRVIPGFNPRKARDNLRAQLTKDGWRGFVVVMDKATGELAITPFREDVEAEIDKPAEG